MLDTIVRSDEGTVHTWALRKVPGFRMEPYMHSVEDNLQGIYFKPAKMLSSWRYTASKIMQDEDFGRQMDQKLDNEEQVIADAKALKTDNEKIAFLFNTVKNTVKWNYVDAWYTQDGVKKAWLKKTGNCTEINLILYHLLKSSGIKPSLLVLGTRDNGELELDNAGFSRLNKTVVRVPIDSLNSFVLDASGKYNTFFDTPYDLLGINMLPIGKEQSFDGLIKLKTDVQSKSLVLINAEIQPEGKLHGNTQLSSSNYMRTTKLVTYDKVGEKKYIKDELEDGNNNLHVSDLRFEDMESDTLPLRENFNFKLELTGADDNYIYFSPNLFTGLVVNPFLGETRLSDIDFMYPAFYSINGHYKVPKGFKIDVIPKTVTILMSDNSISFKRAAGEIDGDIIVHYVIDFRKTKYTRDEYPELRTFYKKMFELLNEQIVLKKG